jgi:hypothetical protein
MQEQIIKLVGNSKHNMKIWHRYQILFTAFNPCFPLGVLAFWTMTVTAAVITYANVPAMIALINVSP